MKLVLFNFHDCVLLITIFLCIILGLIFITSWKYNKWLPVFAGLFFAAEAAIPFDTLISFGEKFHDFILERKPDLLHVFEMAFWLEGPLLLWLVRASLSGSYRPKWTDLVYLLPFFLFFLHQYMAYHSLPTMEKVYLEKHNTLLTESVSVFYLVMIRALLRLYFGTMILYELHKTIGIWPIQTYGSTRDGWSWLRVLSIGFFCFWCWGVLIAICLISNNHYSGEWNVGAMGLLNNYAVSILLAFTLIAMANQGITSIESITDSIEGNQTTYSHSYKDFNNASHQLNEKETEEVLQLESHLKSHKPYLQSDLSLETLATELNWQPRHLSSLISRHYRCHFFEFLNKFRIEEAKQRMQSEQYKHATILDIMYECGFNSKTTFNTCFKKHTGQTPREFKRSTSDSV